MVRFRFISMVVLCVLLVLMAISTVGRGVSALPPPTRLFYFNPDSTLTNLVSLKLEMDIFLQQSGLEFNFAPFAKLKDFDRMTRSDLPEFVLLPKWYWEKNGEALQLVPILIPSHNGSTTYQKVLLAPKDADFSQSGLERKTMAMTTMGPDGEAILNKILFAQINSSSSQLNMVETPKDADALFALVLGQVDLALVGKDNIAQVAKMNPRLVDRVRALAETTPISLPLLCCRKGSASAEQIEAMKKLILGTNDKSVKIMEMLQIDAWHAYSK